MRISGLGRAVEAFYSDFNRYPTSQEGLLILREGEVVYLRAAAFNDSWGNELIYRETPDNDLPFALYSKGPDGVDDGGHADDINYWHLKDKKVKVKSAIPSKKVMRDVPSIILKKRTDRTLHRACKIRWSPLG